MNYVFAAVPVNNIAFAIGRNYVVRVVAGANQGGVVGSHYRFLSGDQDIVPHAENYANAARWQLLSQAEVDALPTGNAPVYDSDVTIRFANALQNKFFIVKHADTALPTLTLRNVGNMLLAQRQQILEWIASHAGNAEAIARYDAQLLTIDAKLEELGLTENITVGELLVDWSNRIWMCYSWMCPP